MSFSMNVATHALSAADASRMADDCEARALEARHEYDWTSQQYYWSEAVKLRAYASELDEAAWKAELSLTGSEWKF